MNENSKITILLCSHLCTSSDMKPFETKEWTLFSENLKINKIQPFDILSFSDDDFRVRLGLDINQIERINMLIERNIDLEKEIKNYEKINIKIMTRDDATYPELIKSKLYNLSPPILYYCGDLALLSQKYIGFVGSRSIEQQDEDFTNKIVTVVNKKGFGVVSGGAKGVDSIATSTSLKNNLPCIEYISDSMNRKLRNKDTLAYIESGKLLVFSTTKPDAGFEVGNAMARNKLIYAQSEGTVVVKADYNKGGTWSGATENLKKQYCDEYCWKNNDYKGNSELIKLGAIGIDENWDGELALKLFSIL